MMTMDPRPIGYLPLNLISILLSSLSGLDIPIVSISQRVFCQELHMVILFLRTQ